MGINREIELQVQNDELRKALHHAQRSASKRSFQNSELVEAVYRASREATSKEPPIIKPPKSDKRKAKAEIALLHSTDWQIGKTTVDYNMEIAYERIKMMCEKVIEITNLHRASTPVREVHLMLGGDMVEGISIFPGQAWEIEAHLFEQLFYTVDLIVAIVTTLLAEFDSVVVWEEAGNHGRIGRKGENPAGDNIDRIAYKIAMERLVKQNKRLTWNAMDSWHQIVEIGNYRALLVHGDEIASVGGIVRKVQQWQSGVVAPFRDCYMGHFHRPDTYTLASGGSVYITGSIESSNEYANLVMAATGRPSQRLHFIDPNKGRVTAEYRLWLD